jgi:Hint domain
MHPLARPDRPDHPVAPTDASGLLLGTRVRTIAGILPVEFLEPGDRIVTRTGAATLISLSSTLRKAAPVVRIRAGTLGSDRPEADLFMAPGQALLIRDWRALALYGTPAATVPASRLADGEFIRVEVLATARFFTLRFETAQVIYAEGLEIACQTIAATAGVAR